MATPYWTRVLDNAEKRVAKGKAAFTQTKMLRSKEWTTCACGKQDARIPRAPSGCPIDDRLADLGCGFIRAINDANINHARRILAQIEKRAAVVLRQATKGKR